MSEDVFYQDPITIEIDEKDQLWRWSMPFQEYYSLTEVCALVARARGAVDRLVRQGTIPGYDIDGVMHVSHEGVVAFLREYERRKVTVVPIRPDREPKPPKAPKPHTPSPRARELLEKDGTFELLRELRPNAARMFPREEG